MSQTIKLGGLLIKEEDAVILASLELHARYGDYSNSRLFIAYLFLSLFSSFLLSLSVCPSPFLLHSALIHFLSLPSLCLSPPLPSPPFPFLCPCLFISFFGFFNWGHLGEKQEGIDTKEYKAP